MSVRTDASGRQVVSRGMCIALMSVAVVRFLVIVPAWYRGQPPAYEGQYLSRLTNLLVTVPLMLITYFSLGSKETLWTRWRALAYFALLTIASAAMGFEWVQT